MQSFYYCEYCASPRVQIQEWRTANTDEWAGEGTADPYCPDCENETICEAMTIASDDIVETYNRAAAWAEACKKAMHDGRCI